MNSYKPTEDFTDKVMEQVRKIHLRQQRQLLLAERLIGALPIRTLLSLAAILGGIWNLLRIWMMLSPALCR